jgi:HTH-type transcriptional regulator/antitoxin HigA
MNKVGIIKTEEDYQSALKRLDKIFDSEPGTKEGDELELLALLIEDYEDKHYPIGPPDPVEAIKFRMEQLGMKQKDLGEILGLKSRASEILNKKRKLTLKMIRAINKELRIPTEILIKEY